ncbi:uncharacterized protein LOC143565245 [Bidens hawaiensis]|uniref:uncharacterized protein LOC143565245 n=1 Tax=Bidens hawaiensis TaxID=980011 RepID=UPI00404B327C
MSNGESSKNVIEKFGKLEKFEGIDFRRWQKKMNFFLTTLKLVYVLSTPMPVVEMSDDENVTMQQTQRQTKWKNDDYLCRGHILNGMFDSLFDVYHSVESTSELWETLESKYMTEDASSKKFLVGNFLNHKMVDSRSVMEQYDELLRMLGQFKQYNMNMDESIAMSSMIDKLPPSWKDFKNTMKHKNEEYTMVELGTTFQIEESIRAQEKVWIKKPTGSNSVNMVESSNAAEKRKGKRKF